jgi:hypothetical protein
LTRKLWIKHSGWQRKQHEIPDPHSIRTPYIGLQR